MKWLYNKDGEARLFNDDEDITSDGWKDSPAAFKEEKSIASLGVRELKIIARDRGLTGYSNLSKNELIILLKDT